MRKNKKKFRCIKDIDNGEGIIEYTKDKIYTLIKYGTWKDNWEDTTYNTYWFRNDLGIEEDIVTSSLVGVSFIELGPQLIGLQFLRRLFVYNHKKK